MFACLSMSFVLLICFVFFTEGVPDCLHGKFGDPNLKSVGILHVNNTGYFMTDKKGAIFHKCLLLQNTEAHYFLDYLKKYLCL